MKKEIKMSSILEYMDFSAWLALGIGVVATCMMYWIAHQSSKEQKLKTQN